MVRRSITARKLLPRLPSHVRPYWYKNCGKNTSEITRDRELRSLYYLYGLAFYEGSLLPVPRTSVVSDAQLLIVAVNTEGYFGCLLKYIQYERVLRILASTLVRHSPDLSDQLRRPCLKKRLHHDCTRCTSSPDPAIPACACMLACVQYTSMSTLFFNEIGVYPSTPKRKRFVQTKMFVLTDGH